MTAKILDTICSAKIFCDADKEILKKIFSSYEPEILTYKKGETIYSLSQFRLAVGIILKGSARVVKDNGIEISTLKEKEIFGCASLFASRDYYVNNIVAAKDCRAIFIDKATVEMIMKEDNNFSLSFIRYLSDRLYYLNTRIVSFTGGNAESRLAYYLNTCFSKNEGGEIVISPSHLAFSLDVSRASLYRAFDKLCESGAVQKNGKTVTLVNEAKLKSFLP